MGRQEHVWTYTGTQRRVGREALGGSYRNQDGGSYHASPQCAGFSYDLGMTEPAATRPQELPPALVALVSSIELSSTDWWRRSVGQAVLSLLWLSPVPITVSELVRHLDEQYSIKVAVDEVRQQLEQMAQKGAIVEQSDASFKVSEEQSLRTQKDIDRHETEDAAARRDFLELMTASMPDSDANEAWRNFNHLLLVPLIHRLGAHTYDFLRGSPFELKESPLVENFLQSFTEADRPAARSIVTTFLDPQRPTTRAYVVNRLATYFFIQATRLPRSTLEALTQSVKKRVVFTVFVDTNLLFSLLDLHENPANEAAVALEGLLKDLRGLVDFKLYVTNETLHEAKESLGRAADGMESVVLTPNMAAAAGSMSLSGLRRRYVEQARRADGVRNSDAYFSYYVDNLLALARAHGIELYNEDLSPFHTRQEVVNDLLEQRDVQAKRRAAQGRPAKSYSQIQHDVVLWHWTRGKREAYVESPLLAKYWIVTIDYALLGFDAYKQKILRGSVPVCLHPTTLVQMLAFWAPRGEALDSAIVRTLRMPLLFFEYDAELERATIRILRTLSRFEHSSHLSTESIAELMASDALRSRMLAANADEEMVGLIESELIEQEESLRRRLIAEQEQVREFREKDETSHKRIKELAEAAARGEDEAARLRQETEAAIAATTAAGDRAVFAESRVAHLRLTIFAVFALLLAAVPAVVVWLAVSDAGRPAALFVVLGWLALSCLGWLGVVRWLGTSEEREAARGLRAWINGYFVVIVVGFILNGISAWVFG